MRYIFLLGISIASFSISAAEISYFKKNPTSLANKKVGDIGAYPLFIIPMSGVADELTTKCTIQIERINKIDHHRLPGKSFIYGGRRAIYHKQHYQLKDRPRDIFVNLSENTPHTFALTPNQLKFVESTATPLTEKAKDRFTKHYLISGLKREVHFAGEFFVYRDRAKNEVHVVFDNNSGTYTPDTSYLEQLKKVLELNFKDEGLFFHVKKFNQKVLVEKMMAGEEDFLAKKDDV